MVPPKRTGLCLRVKNSPRKMVGQETLQWIRGRCGECFRVSRSLCCRSCRRGPAEQQLLQRNPSFCGGLLRADYRLELWILVAATRRASRDYCNMGCSDPVGASTSSSILYPCARALLIAAPSLFFSENVFAVALAGVLVAVVSHCWPWR